MARGIFDSGVQWTSSKAEALAEALARPGGLRAEGLKTKKRPLWSGLFNFRFEVRLSVAAVSYVG